MQIQIDTVVPISSSANPILNVEFDDTLVSAPVGPSRPKKGSAVLQCLHNNLQVYLVYYVHNFAFVFHHYIDCNSQHSLHCIINGWNNGRVYVGQTISPHKRLFQHARFPTSQDDGRW